MIAGRATAAGTERFRQRFGASTAEGHFRRLGDLWLSSIGLGTYLGEADEVTDRSYEEAVIQALESGCNVLDTAINYRHQRSERAVGRALARAFDRGVAQRDEVFVSTKGGFLPFDGALPADPLAYLREVYFDTGLVGRGELAAGCHAMSPAFLTDQLRRSRDNLGLELVDLYYLHNPETQLGELPAQRFAARLLGALRWLAARVAEGKIGRFGLATWNAFRVPTSSPEHIGLAELAELARRVDPSAALAAVQMPLNLAMPEALAAPVQTLDEVAVPPLVATRRLTLGVFTSASILQGRLARGLPEEISRLLPGPASDAQRALQFTRSAPGVTTALVGMSQAEHVRENLALAEVEPAPPEALERLFRPR